MTTTLTTLTTLTSLIAKSARTGEIVHASLSTLIDGLIIEAGEAGDEEMVHDCEFARCVLAGTSDEDATEDRKGIATIRKALLAGVADVDGVEHTYVTAEDGNDEIEVIVEVADADSAPRAHARVHLALR
jgi:hypothetical protein